MQADYLQFAAGMGAGHENLVPLFKRALEAGAPTKLSICAPAEEDRGPICEKSWQKPASLCRSN